MWYQPIYADYFDITAAELEKNGINYNLLDPINLSQDGDFFVACEKITDVKQKAEGYTRKLKILRFNNKKLEKVEEIRVPVTQWVNGAIGGGKRKNEVFVIGDFGNKILRIDLKAKDIQTLYQYQRGKAGFKAGPFLWSHQGIFYATGWAFDNQQYWKGDYLITFQENQKGEIDLANLANLANIPFTYPFLSEDGRVLVVVTLDNKHKTVSAYHGNEKDGYRLRKFIHNAQPGAMKLSANGKVFLHMHQQGIRIFYLD